MLARLLAVAAICIPAAAVAETHSVAPGDDAQERLQEALILAEPGDTIQLEAGRYAMTDGLSLDVDNVTLRGTGSGEGEGASVLDFTGQQGAGEGLLVTSDGVTLRDFAVENPKGDGIKSKNADEIVYYRLRVDWTNGPDENNGAYGIYPVESSGVLVDSVTVRGASDAGIYVGQSTDIVVRNSHVAYNVAGIEIENSRRARVTGNYVTHNTGGILVFDLPNLPVMGGGEVLVDHNIVVANDTPNFAPAGNIVASVPMGAGIMVLSNEQVAIARNVIADNATAGVMVLAYSRPFKDARFDPLPRRVAVLDNQFRRNGFAPAIPGGAKLAAAMGGQLGDVLWDGLGENALLVAPGISTVSLGYTEIGQQPDAARPAFVTDRLPLGDQDNAFITEHPPELEARATP